MTDSCVLTPGMETTPYSVNVINDLVKRSRAEHPADLRKSAVKSGSLSYNYRNSVLLAKIKLQSVNSIGSNNTQSLCQLIALYSSRADVNAVFLSDRPLSPDAGRAELASQAAEYIRASYRGKALRNPFTGLCRKTASLIAYNRSGAFTSAERLAAYDQINKSDGDYDNMVYNKTHLNSWQNAEYGKVVELATLLKKVAGMSEGEKQEKDITEELNSVIQRKIDLLEEKYALRYQAVEYANLVSPHRADLLIVSKTSAGVFTWKTAGSENLYQLIKHNRAAIALSGMVSLY
ncbi:hypothetical protein [Pantoea sp. BAV 3049]|uniref:hypothetical protein n=1 Tax=Pantoea sp. BAV 3049 TaxID=2654188 RepID=UPI00131DC09D|nr:hypothetical protein [Pantoea sp. BAV 3049]